MRRFNRHTEVLHIAKNSSWTLCRCVIFHCPHGPEWPKRYGTSFITIRAMDQAFIFYYVSPIVCRECLRVYLEEYARKGL